MEKAGNELTQKLMDAFFRIMRMHPKNHVPGVKHSEIVILLFIKRKMDKTQTGIRIGDLSRIMRLLLHGYPVYQPPGGKRFRQEEK